jgi:hypothetical protein
MIDDGTITDTEAGYSPLVGIPPISERRELIRPRCGNRCHTSTPSHAAIGINCFNLRSLICPIYPIKRPYCSIYSQQISANIVAADIKVGELYIKRGVFIKYINSNI